MPASLETTIEGYILFTAVKLAGYTFYTLALNRAFFCKRRALVVGATRTLPGITLGTAYYFLWRATGTDTHQAGYWIGLIPIRLFEWWLVIRLFYGPGALRSNAGWRMIALGTIWS